MLRVKTDKILPEYMLYALKVEGEYERFSRTYRASIQKIKQLIIQVPPIDTQKEIISELQKYDEIIEREDSKLKEYDENIKSKFVEMFSGKMFKSEKLRNLYDLQIGKTPSRSNNEYWGKDGYKWISIADMANFDRYTGLTSELITDLAINETGIKCIPKGTVIMSFKLTIGRTAITAESIYTNEAIVAFIDKKEAYINKDYLRLYLRLYDWSLDKMSAVKGATLNQGSIGDANLQIPPEDLQNQFAFYVEEIDKLKFEAKERKIKAEQEKESLIEKYFR